ncbi:GumC family protein [Novosphingobium rosa]|uniref:GumC family protein n=1 Tax=Novosphingobium rosa TaxID=76978 RepID=UPI0009FC8628|nr:polysaccharide biosynthesis tyrosine autokinase [Novosphingobium rosa]
MNAQQPVHGDDPCADHPHADHHAMSAAEQDNDLLDFEGLRLTLMLNRKLIALILTLGLALGVASVVFMPRTYTARSSVQIDQQTRKVLGTEDADPQGSAQDADRFLQTQVDILNSRAMAKHVSDTLGLATSDAFLKRTSGRAPTNLEPGELEDRVIDTLQRNLIVDLPHNSRVVGVMFKSRDAALAAQISNTFVSEFIKGNIQRKFSASSYSLDFLSNQLNVAKSRLEESERTLITYSRTAGLIDASTGAAVPVGQPQGPQSLVTANLVELNQRQAVAKADRLQAEERWRQASSTPLMQLPEVLSNNAVQQLLQSRAQLSSKLQELRARLKPDHPTVIQATTELNELDNEARVLAESIRGSIKNQYLVAVRQDDAIQAAVNGLKSATLSEQDRTVRFNILKREVDTNRQLYDSLLQRYKEVSAASGVTVNNITQVDVAEAPRKPTSPRALLNMAVALGASVVLAAMAVLLRSRMSTTITDPREVETRLGLPLLGAVPIDPTGEPLTTLLSPKSDIAEAYHAIRTAVELSSRTGTPSSILLTSNRPSEGKSTSSFALARDFALLGKKVLLIDADLRRPTLHRLLDVDNSGDGFSTVLARRMGINEAVVATRIENLSFLPTGPIPPDPANLFSGPVLRELLEGLRASYDLVVLDSPPVLSLADTVELTSAAQATIFVMEAGSAQIKAMRQSLERLRRSGGHVLGAIVSKYDARTASGTHGYAYGYSYGD